MLLDHLAMIQCSICSSVVHAGSRLRRCKQQQQQQHGVSLQEIRVTELSCATEIDAHLRRTFQLDFCDDLIMPL